MKTIINEIAVLNRATVMVKKGICLGSSLETSVLIEKLQFRLMNGTVEFCFIKKNGEVRHAFGTLLEKPVVRNIIGTGTPRSDFNLQAYYDVEEQAWRSFRYENLIAILK